MRDGFCWPGRRGWGITAAEKQHPLERVLVRRECADGPRRAGVELLPNKYWIFSLLITESCTLPGDWNISHWIFCS